MEIGFIGCGNMATAIINGIIATNTVNEKEIYIYDVFEGATNSLKAKHEVNVCDSECDIAKKCDAIILAVKPNIIASVLEKIKDDTKDKLIISIAAGKKIEFIQGYLFDDSRIIRVMPNINATVGEAISAYTANANATDDDKALAESIFNGVGETIYLDEKQFALFGVLGGCSPAFSYMFIDELARAGVKNGMPKDVALKIAAQAVYGSAKMIMESDEHPYKLVDKVCSPGGTTIEGVTSLQADGFDKAIHNAVDKALEKDAKL